MAQADPRGAQGRKPKLGRTVMIDSVRGVLRVRKWPKPRGKPRNEKEAYWQEWFREAQICAKYAPAQDIIAAREATKGTVWRPRDLQMKAMRGRMWTFITPDGRKIYSMSQRVDVSEGLDIISQYPGSMLVRGEMYWEYLLPGPKGYVLTSVGENRVPEWRSVPAGGGGVGYTPPLLSDFPDWVNQRDTVAEQAPQGNLVMSAPPWNVSVNIRLRVKPYPGGARKYILGFSMIAGDISEASAGLFLRDSATGNIIRYNLRWNTAADTHDLVVDYYKNEGTYSTTRRQASIASTDKVFLRIRDDGTNLYFDHSSDNAAWLNFVSASRTEFLSNVDQIAIGVNPGAGGYVGVSASFFHYEEAVL